MSRCTDQNTPRVEKTGETGVDEKGEYYILRTYGKQYCRCHPETCPHFDGIISVDYKEKIYINKKP